MTLFCMAEGETLAEVSDKGLSRWVAGAALQENWTFFPIGVAGVVRLRTGPSFDIFEVLVLEVERGRRLVKRADAHKKL